MSNIRVDIDYTIKDGTEIKFRSPVDCSQITGLIVYYPGADGNTVSKVFALSDAHGNNVGDIDHLFAEDVVVKVILDVTKSMAFVQNADTNAYLEAQLASKTSMELLWENASPLTIFAAQTIELDLSGYDAVMIQAGNAGYEMILCEISCPVGKTMALNATSGNQEAGLGEVQSAIRGVSVTTNGVVFMGGRAGVSSYADTNNAMIPYRIYGIKMAGSPGSGGTEVTLPAAEGVSF